MLRTVRKESNVEEIANKFIIILAIIALGSFLLTLFYVPLIQILRFAFSSESRFTFAIFRSTITDTLNLKFIGFTFTQALLSTVICLFIGLPAGFFFAKYEFKGRKIILNLLTIPFVLPPIVVLLGFIVSFGEGGWINSIWKGITGTDNVLISIFGTFEGIVLAHVFYNLSVIIRMTIPAWQSLDLEQVEVSRTLGASEWKIFWKIIFPQIVNYLISSALLVFIYTFNSFAIVLYLGEVRFQTLEVRIFKMMKASLDFSGGASLAFLQLILNTIIIILYLVFERKTRQMAVGRERGIQKEKISFSRYNWKKNFTLIGLIFFILIVGVFTFAPILAVIIVSFTPFSPEVSPFFGYAQLFSFEYNPLLQNSPLRLLVNTLLFAFAATIITLILSLMIVFVLKNRYQSLKRYQRSVSESFISYMIILPMATSSITLALGIFLLFNNTSMYLNAVWFFIIMAHVLISVPFATRSIMAAYNRIDVELLNVASTLGASRLRVFRKIELPLILRGIIVGGIFSFAISLGEFGATNFLVRGAYGTLSIGISKLLLTQTLQLPATMASILIIVTIICFLAIQKLGDVELKV